MSEDVNELQKEWRAIVLDKLSSLENTQNDIKRDIVDIKTSFVRQHTLEEKDAAYRAEVADLKRRVEELSNFRWKLVGILLGSNAVFVVVAWTIEQWIGAHHK